MASYNIDRITHGGNTYNINIDTSRLKYQNGIANKADPTIMPLIDIQRANRLAFLPADQIIVEQTVDGGTTWTSANVSDNVKRNVFSPVRGTINVPQIDGKKNPLCGLRVTFTGMKYDVPSGTTETEKYNYWNSDYILSTNRYCTINGLYFWVSTGPDTMNILVQTAKGATPNNWATQFQNDSYYMNGWSGWDFVPIYSGTVLGGSVTQTNNYWNWRITLMTRGINGSATEMSTNSQTGFQQLSEIRAYGSSCWVSDNPLMRYDHMYEIDSSKNVTFPAKVTANSFAGNITGNVTGNVSGKVNNHTVNSDVPANAVFTDTTYESKPAASGGTAVSLVTTGEKYTWNNGMLPSVSSSDNGKVLQVDNGQWAAKNGAGIKDMTFSVQNNTLTVTITK